MGQGLRALAKKSIQIMIHIFLFLKEKHMVWIFLEALSTILILDDKKILTICLKICFKRLSFCSFSKQDCENSAIP